MNGRCAARRAQGPDGSILADGRVNAHDVRRFLETVPSRFGVADLGHHYHLPLKMTPWGFSLCRAGT